MATEPMIPVLVYSMRHDPSKKVLDTIKALNKTSMFKYICIEEVPRSSIPAGITLVPTIMLPETGKLLTGHSQIMPYLAQPVETRRQQYTKQNDMPRELRQEKAELLAFEKDDPLDMFEQFEGVDGGDGLAPSGGPVDFGAMTSKMSEQEMKDMMEARQNEFSAMMPKVARY